MMISTLFPQYDTSRVFTQIPACSKPKKKTKKTAKKVSIVVSLASSY